MLTAATAKGEEVVVNRYWVSNEGSTNGFYWFLMGF